MLPNVGPFAALIIKYFSFVAASPPPEQVAALAQTLTSQQLCTKQVCPPGQSAEESQVGKPSHGVEPSTQTPVPSAVEPQTQSPPGPQFVNVAQVSPVQADVEQAELT